MAQRVEHPKDQQVITLLTRPDKERFLKLCRAWSMNESECARNVILAAIRSEEVGTPIVPSGRLLDGDGYEYDATLVPDEESQHG